MLLLAQNRLKSKPEKEADAAKLRVAQIHSFDTMTGNFSTLHVANAVCKVCGCCCCCCICISVCLRVWIQGVQYYLSLKKKEGKEMVSYKYILKQVWLKYFLVEVVVFIAVLVVVLVVIVIIVVDEKVVVVVVFCCYFSGCYRLNVRSQLIQRVQFLKDSKNSKVITFLFFINGAFIRLYQIGYRKRMGGCCCCCCCCCILLLLLFLLLLFSFVFKYIIIVGGVHITAQPVLLSEVVKKFVIYKYNEERLEFTPISKNTIVLFRITLLSAIFSINNRVNFICW